MRTPPPGFRPTPSVPAALLLTLAVRVVPAAERDRYDAEFRAELCSLTVRRQIATAASLLAGSFALRRALSDPEKGATMSTHKPLRCWVHHDYQRFNDDNPENRRNQHLECARCGKFKEDDTTDDFPKNARPPQMTIGGGGLF